MKRYDNIVEVEKNIDEIVEVEKFNPFHDSAGKFSSSNGFKTYSANPNTKAGAMAIARSAAAGHGNTMNVHRQSYGENIRQNANWLGRGKQQNSRHQGSATLRSRVEPISGLSGASSTGASWQSQNQQQGRTTHASTKPQPKPQQPKPQQQAASSNQNTNSTTPKQAPQKPQQKPTTQTNGHKMVDGKDLWTNASPAEKANLKRSTTSEILKKQGMDGEPQTVKSLDDLKKLAKANGNLMFRTYNNDNESQASARFDQFKKGDFFISEGNNNAFGNGMYVAETTKKNRTSVTKAFGDSGAYGSGRASDKMMFMTIDKSAKRISFDNLKREAAKDGLNLDGWGGGSMNGGDIGSYAASKGYDVILGNGGRSDYSVVLNRSKVTVCEFIMGNANRYAKIPTELQNFSL